LSAGDAFSLSSGQFVLFSILGLFVALAGILVAFDAYDRGVKKVTCILWFFSIQLFPPVILLYFFFRPGGMAKQGRGGGRITGENKSPEEVICPYCGNSLNEKDRICSKCGRLL